MSVPSRKDGNARVRRDRRPSAASATDQSGIIHRRLAAIRASTSGHDGAQRWASGCRPLYDDAVNTNACESGNSRITRLHGDEAMQHLGHESPAACIEPNLEVLEVIGRA